MAARDLVGGDIYFIKDFPRQSLHRGCGLHRARRTWSIPVNHREKCLR